MFACSGEGYTFDTLSIYRNEGARPGPAHLLSCCCVLLFFYYIYKSSSSLISSILLLLLVDGDHGSINGEWRGKKKNKIEQRVYFVSSLSVVSLYKYLHY